MTVVIDAGHGGKDPGNLNGSYRIAEKDITLAVAKKTAAYIEERIPGVRVIMTRTDDTYPELSDRVRIANEAEPTCCSPSIATASRNPRSPAAPPS